MKKTKTGPSTDADSLQKLAEEHPIVETLLRYREVEKLRSTYADALPPLVGADGRIHATFNQLATTTGRISSEAPNLQNVPVRTSAGRELRKAFIADEGCGLLTADYSQIELRVLAHLAEDPGPDRSVRRGADVHTTTAAAVFHVAEDKVDEFQRRFAKVVNYGLAYGMEAYGLGTAPRHPDRSGPRDPRRLLRRLPEHRRVHDRDDPRGEGARATRPRCSAAAASSPSCRPTTSASARWASAWRRTRRCRARAADIFKLAMIDLDRALDDGGLDEPDGADRARRARARGPARRAGRGRAGSSATTMEHVTELRVPLVVDIGFGPTWADAK